MSNDNHTSNTPDTPNYSIEICKTTDAGQIPDLLITDNLGIYRLSIANRDNDLVWFGPYHTGKLAIYIATLCKPPEMESVNPLVYVYVDDFNFEMNALGYRTYYLGVTPEEAITDLLDVVVKTLTEKEIEAKDKAMSNGTLRVH